MSLFILILGYPAYALISDGVSAWGTVKPLVDEVITTISVTCPGTPDAYYVRREVLWLEWR
jgi:hypothetical protein